DELARRAMGQTRRLAERIDLAAMLPRGDIASSEYALVNPGQEYVVYLPDGGEVTMDLRAAVGTLAVEWIHPLEGPVQPAGQVAGGSEASFTPPFEGGAALYLKALNRG
ncbi:MAG: putative collagen-binding domain-containing protein, partial [Anaerolineae bacterium]|nr:putative collagen-binding domain-containing protein [Anaerolineae bacterium]